MQSRISSNLIFISKPYVTIRSRVLRILLARQVDKVYWTSLRLYV